MSILDQPWHTRVPLYEEERRYTRILKIHQLTQNWLKELLPEHHDSTLYRIERMPQLELVQNLWFLERLKLDHLPPALSDIVDGTTVTELLNDLEETVWIVQASTLENALEQASDSKGLLSILDRISWSFGKVIAEEEKGNSPRNARDFFSYFSTSFLSENRSFLLESYDDHHCNFYWTQSGLSKEFLKHSPARDELIHLHAEMIRGYGYGLETTYKVDVAQAKLQKTDQIKITVSRQN